MRKSADTTWLARCMRAANINDPKLAESAGTSRQQIFKLRTGENRLTVEWAKRLAPHLGVTWQELIEGPPSQAGRQRAELLAIFDGMADSDRETLLRIAKGLRSPENPQPRKAAAERRSSNAQL